MIKLNIFRKFKDKPVEKLLTTKRNISSTHFLCSVETENSIRFRKVEGFLSESKLNNKKGALLAIEFFDKNFSLITPSKIEGLSISEKIGYYSYISTSKKKSKFQVKFKTPVNTTLIKFLFRPWATKNDKVLLSEVSCHPIDEDEFKSRIYYHYINEYKKRKGYPFKSEKVIQDIKKALKKERDPKKRYDILCSAFYLLKDTLALNIAQDYGLKAVEIEPDLQLAKDVLFSFRKNGSITKTYELRRKFVEKGILTEDRTLKKLKVEHNLLSSKFLFPSVSKLTPYVPEKKSLYLLHNSLPFNSGGYATRTHGLLTNVNGFGKYQIAAASRLGYPNDMQAFISKTLPKEIPKNSWIDNVQYFRLHSDYANYGKSDFFDYMKYYTSELEKLAIQQKVSIIHGASNYPNGIAAITVAKRLGIKSVYEVRGLWEITRISRQPEWENSDQYNLLVKMETLACQNADAVFALTIALKEILIKRGVDGNKITVLPNAVDAHKFLPQSKNIELAKSLKINHKTVIGYIGSIVNYEGLDDLIRATKLLKDRGRKDFALLIVGDGAFMNRLKEVVNELNVEELVIFTGRVPHDEVQDYYSIVDIAPFPRKPYLVCEAVSPLKPFEAMAMKKAVIVSSCAALTEIIEDGKTGLVFNKGDVNDLADKLSLLISQPKLRNSLGDTGYSWVLEERTWKVISKKVVDLYDRMLN